MIIQVRNALSFAYCCDAMDIYDQYKTVAARKDHMGHPILYCHQSELDPAAIALVNRIVRDCRQELVVGLRLSEPIYPETVLLTAIGIGGYVPRHADNMQLDDQGQWVPNHVPQRDFSALIYLNSDFEGGEIEFEKQDIVIKPCAGLLVAFPSTQDYVHQVLPVRSGYRYSMPIWFTRRKSFAISDLIGREADLSPR